MKIISEFLTDFFNNFGGDFLPYREILLKFDENYRKLCKLKSRLGPTQDTYLWGQSAVVKKKLQAVDKPLQEMKSRLEGRVASNEYLKSKGWKKTETNKSRAKRSFITI